MFFTKKDKQIEDLRRKLDDKATALCNKECEIISLKTQKQHYESEVKFLQKKVSELSDMLACVITTTFEDRDVFETVLFQKKNKMPIIFRNGIKMDAETAKDVSVSFAKDGYGVDSKVKMSHEG